MGLENFISEIFVNEVQLNVEDALLGFELCTREYEGPIRNQGDTVTIPIPTSLTVNAYTGTVTYEDPDSSKVQLVITEADYIAGTIKDTDQAVSSHDLANIYLKTGISGLSSKADQYIYKTMAAGAHADNTIDTITLSTSNIISTIESAESKLTDSGVPISADKFIVITSKELSLLRRSSDFIKASELSDDVLVNGQVGKLFGMRVIVSNNVYTEVAADIPDGDPVHRLLPFGVVNATAFASAIPYDSAETMRLESKFATGIRALHYYGAKVLLPSQIGVIKADTGIDGTDT